MNTHYRNNLEAVMQVNKTYTDKQVKKAKDELLTFFSRNTVETDDHTNELAYQITAPSGAKLLQLQAIGGNTVKLSPSVASDSTKAMIKTMPATVYDFDGSKFYGDSEVSENLIVLNDVAETTVNGITYSIKDGVITLNGTATANININLILNSTAYPTGIFATFNSQANSNVSIYNLKSNGAWGSIGFGLSTVNRTYTINDNTDLYGFRLYIKADTKVSNFVIKPFYIKGSIAPTEFKVGFSGIHNLELSGLKVEGANLISTTDYTMGGDAYNATITITKQLEVGTTYTISFDTAISSNLVLTNATLVSASGYISRTSIVFTPTDNNVVITFVGGSTSNNLRDKLNNMAWYMLNYGSTALDYVPYIQPTTKTIDLSTILYNGSPLFEGNSLKGVGTAKDYITPYLAHKEMFIYTLTGNETWNLKIDESYMEANITLPTTVVNSSLTSLSDKLTYKINGWTEAGNEYTFMIIGGGTQIRILMSATLTQEQCRSLTSGIIVIVKLATPIEVSIDWSSTLRNIQGYSNGSIIAENTHNMDVESVITYNSIIQETLCPSVSVDGANLWNGNQSYNVGESSGSSQYSTTLNKGTYTLSFIKERISGVTITNNTVYNFRVKDSNNTTIYSGTTITLSSGSKSMSGTFTIDNDNTKVSFYLGNNNGDTNINTNVNTIMLNRGSTALSYRPYKQSITRNLPTQASDGYGVNANAHNLRVFSDYEGNAVNKRYTNMDKGDMRTPTWNYNSTAQQFSTSVINDLKLGNWQDAGNILCKPYTTIAGTNLSSSDMCIALNDSTRNIFAKDSKYTDGATFKLANTNEPLYYELADASKTETDMDDFDYFFDVEEGDVITFDNPYAQQVYATYSFIIKEAKSNE